MRASTHAGLSGPIASGGCDTSDGLLRVRSDGQSPRSASLAFGVAHSFTSRDSAGRKGAPSYALRLPPVRCDATGVCQCLTTSPICAEPCAF